MGAFFAVLWLFCVVVALTASVQAVLKKKKNLPLVSASLELTELSLLLFIRLLQLSQADTEFHFHCVQHIQRQFTVQLQREATRWETFPKPTHFQLWATRFLILPVPPSSAASCTSCWGPAFWAGQCGIVSLWPPEGFVCLLQEDSLDPLMSHLDGMQKKLKLEE